MTRINLKDDTSLMVFMDNILLKKSYYAKATNTHAKLASMQRVKHNELMPCQLIF